MNISDQIKPNEPDWLCQDRQELKVCKAKLRLAAQIIEAQRQQLRTQQDTLDSLDLKAAGFLSNCFEIIDVEAL